MILDEIKLEIKCASVPMLLTKLTSCGIAVRQIEYVDQLTFYCSISWLEYKNLVHILKKYGAEGKIIRRKGLLLKLGRIRKRPVLLFGILLILALILYLPSRILFVSVTGNERIATKLILEKAAANGVCFGASRHGIRSERIKNGLLGDIPELQWVGINTYGCLAVISVEERNKTAERMIIPLQPGMVAAKDGIITDISVTRGTALCKVGQAVKKGQMLISGIADYGICVKETGADGEVYGQTGNVLRVLSPMIATKKTGTFKTQKRYNIILGKKVINFYKDSGISGPMCDRMYTQSYIVLPGGLQLPISFAVEEIRYYEIEPIILPDDRMDWIITSAEHYLLDHTVAGEILSKTVSVDFHDGFCELYGVYQCREIISRHQNKGV